MVYSHDLGGPLYCIDRGGSNNNYDIVMLIQWLQPAGAVLVAGCLCYWNIMYCCHNEYKCYNPFTALFQMSSLKVSGLRRVMLMTQS